ncbi:MAG: hypothetical protein WED32_02780 [Patescibacteria group bacterium]
MARNTLVLEGTVEDAHPSGRYGVRTEAGIVLAGLNTRLHREGSMLRRGDRVRVRFDTENPVLAIIVEHVPQELECEIVTGANSGDRR